MKVNQQLVYFQKTAVYSSITRAAEALFVDSSTISKSINNLEEKLGVPLFTKDGRALMLTPYGKKFYYYVESGMSTIEAGIHEMHELANETRGHVNLSTIYSVASYYIPSLLTEFSKTHPEITIDLAQRPSGSVLDSVSEGTSDLGICSNFEQEEDYPNLSSLLLFKEKVDLLVSVDHPLAAKDSVLYEEIKDENFIGYTQNTSITKEVRHAIKTVCPKNYEAKIVYTCNEDNTAASLIRNNLGIGFVPSIPTVDMTGLKAIKVEDILVDRGISLIWNHETKLTKASQTLQKIILSAKAPSSKLMDNIFVNEFL